MVQTWYNPTLEIWPDLKNGRAVLRPVRIGVDRRTGKMMVGWDHVEQSLRLIFATPFHTRVMRYWVGSFVPHILGDVTTVRVIARFYWAIATAIDLWEPNYRINQVDITSSAAGPGFVQNSAEELRLGHFQVRHYGTYRPRGHLGDPTPEQRRIASLIYNNGTWDRGAAL